MPGVNNRPQMPQVAGYGWADRPAEYRRDANTPSYIPPDFRGELAGTPAFDAGAAAPHPREPVIPFISGGPGTTSPSGTIAGSSMARYPSNVDIADLPPPYNWSGDGNVPDELWAMVTDLASAGMPGVPSRDDPGAVAAWLSELYNVLTTPGEGCGLDPHSVFMGIVSNAPQGPHAVAYAIQQAMMTSAQCAQYVKNPLSPPMRSVGNEIPTPTGTITIPPAKKKPSTLTWVIGGAGLLAAIGIGWYFMYRSAKKKKRKNPRARRNPIVVEAWGEETRENPYGGDGGFQSVDGGEWSRAAQVSPLINPSKRRKKSTRPRR